MRNLVGNRLIKWALAATAALPAPIAAQTATPAAPPPSVAVHDQGLVATWYPPASGKRGPALLVLGGSEGGEAISKAVGAAFARQGYGVLALAYFRAPGLPDQLQEIPLEYFTRAIDWLAAQPQVDSERIGLWGASKGGEAALLIASRDPRIHAVVAAVPSSVVWQGINYADYASEKSSYSLNGKPVPYVPYDMGAAFKGVLDLYQRSMANIADHPDAIIPVERINGPVLLISAAADALWPSSEMAAQVIARLDAKHFGFAHRRLDYANAGHGTSFPEAPSDPKAESAFAQMGGTPEGNAAARTDAWAQTLAFFARSFAARRH